MDAEYTSCARFANALACAGGKLAEAADALRGWKGLATATHRVSVAADGDASLITLCLEVQTQRDAFWLWLVEVRCNADGWAVHDRRQGLDEAGEEQAAEMPVREGTTLDDLLAALGQAVTDILRNIHGGWWLRVEPRTPGK